MGIIISIIVGIVASIIGTLFMKGGGYGFWINLLAGVEGAFFCGYCVARALAWLGLECAATTVGYLIASALGATLLLWIDQKISMNL